MECKEEFEKELREQLKAEGRELTEEEVKKKKRENMEEVIKALLKKALKSDEEGRNARSALDAVIAALPPPAEPEVSTKQKNGGESTKLKKGESTKPKKGEGAKPHLARGGTWGGVHGHLVRAGDGGNLKLWLPDSHDVTCPHVEVDQTEGQEFLKGHRREIDEFLAKLKKAQKKEGQEGQGGNGQGGGGEGEEMERLFKGFMDAPPKDNKADLLKSFKDASEGDASDKAWEALINDVGKQAGLLKWIDEQEGDKKAKYGTTGPRSPSAEEAKDNWFKVAREFNLKLGGGGKKKKPHKYMKKKKTKKKKKKKKKKSVSVKKTKSFGSVVSMPKKFFKSIQSMNKTMKRSMKRFMRNKKSKNKKRTKRRGRP